jgi:septal ring factor EnvC (AmiA/AmiB activator)
MNSSRPSKKECFRLFEDGKTPQDLIAVGVPRSSAYSLYHDWSQEKSGIEFMDEGEKTALLFSLFKKGKSLVDVVIQTKMPYDDVLGVLKKYEEASERLVLKEDDVERLVNKFARLQEALSKVEKQIEQYGKRLSDLESESVRVDERLKAQEALIEQRHPALILKDVLGASKCGCGSTGFKILLVCPNCQRNARWG